LTPAEPDFLSAISAGEQIDRCERLVLPGVGAFMDVVATLGRRGLDRPSLRHIDGGRPFRWTGLGLQMLSGVGYGDGEHRGLDVLRGSCVRSLFHLNG
jgi:glutamine amidotransferase